MKHKPQAAAEFLQCLGGDSFVFQTFDDSKNKNKALSRVLIGSYEQHESALIERNEKGAGIFVQSNRGDDRGKDHITGIRSLFVDLDDPSTAKESILAIKEFMPKPTAIVNSSPGKYHIYWKVLDCPVANFKKMQVMLATRFNTDLAMGNLDRVMRLPGFKHQKDEPFLVTAQIFNTVHTVEKIYSAAAKAPTLARTGNGTATKEVNKGSIKKDVFGLNIGSDYELPTATPAEGRNHALIKYVGHITGTGIRDEQEAKEMVRKVNNKFDDPLPENELEATIFQSLAKYIEEAKAEDNAKAQLAMANHNKGIPTPPAAEEGVPVAPVPTAPTKAEPAPVAISIDEVFLERYIFSTEGQKVIDTQATGEYKIIALSDFKALMSNTGKYTTKKWLEHPERKSCRDIMWYPTDNEFIHSQGFRFYNLYCKPDMTAVSKKEFDLSKLDVFFEHMQYLFPNKEDRKFFLDWFAKTVVAPTVRIPWAPLLISAEGAGKNFIFEVLAELLGTENSETVLMQAIESQFNPYMMKSAIVLIDEVSKPKSEAIVDKMKAYISNSTLYINMKGVQERKRPVYANVLMFSNNDDAAAIKDGDRRFWVHKITNIKPSSYYDHIFGWFKRETKTSKTVYTENLSHLLRWCMERDLSKFNHNHRPPETASKKAMIFENRSGLDIELSDAIDHRDGPFAADIVPVKIIKEYVAIKIGRDLTIQEERQVPKILNKYSSRDFCGEALTSIDKNIMERGRARCVRNMDYWAKASRVKMHHEFTRSLQLHLKMQDVLPPVLELVEGDENAESSKS